MIRLGHAILRIVLITGVAFFCSCKGDSSSVPGPDGTLPVSSGELPSLVSVLPGLASEPPGSAFVMAVTSVREGKVLLETGAEPDDLLEFGWIHSVEHFPWTEFFSIAADGSLILREMRVRGYGAGIPHQRSAQVRTEDGWIISSGIDETFPSYNWINSHIAVGQVRLNGTLLFTGSDFPHHEALELRVEPRRRP
ncbi:MAG: hypothetical protein A3J97_15115 [Spirochaetes bacterium RIFOXYC1_FULL_54_7]|nr:MAG: hypothetical protein A3J97_15115 [Spirochaetes bacterium RIFOXYC1_FULL_54_7]